MNDNRHHCRRPDWKLVKLHLTLRCTAACQHASLPTGFCKNGLLSTSSRLPTHEYPDSVISTLADLPSSFNNSKNPFPSPNFSAVRSEACSVPLKPLLSGGVTSLETDTANDSRTRQDSTGRPHISAGSAWESEPDISRQPRRQETPQSVRQPGHETDMPTRPKPASSNRFAVCSPRNLDHQTGMRAIRPRPKPGAGIHHTSATRNP